MVRFRGRADPPVAGKGGKCQFRKVQEPSRLTSLEIPQHKLRVRKVRDRGSGHLESYPRDEQWEDWSLGNWVLNIVDQNIPSSVLDA